MRSTVQTITPAVAKAWLATRETNRKVSPKTVAKYAQLIKDSKWLLNGESIKFDDKGRMIDGQHRCLAIEKTGLAIKSLVVRGLNGASFETFDSGRGRSVPDVLSIYGFRNVIPLAGVTRLAWLHANAGSPASHVFGAIPVQYLVDFLRVPKRESKLVTAADAGTKSAVRGSLFQPRVAGYVYYVSHLIDKKVATEFFAALMEARRPDHPVAALLRRIRQSTVSKSKISLEESLAVTIKAWNALYNNQPLDHLRYRMFGDSPESFPEVAGLDPADL